MVIASIMVYFIFYLVAIPKAISNTIPCFLEAKLKSDKTILRVDSDSLDTRGQFLKNSLFEKSELGVPFAMPMMPFLDWLHCNGRLAHCAAILKSCLCNSTYSERKRVPVVPIVL